ncbi:MAG: hypothetical protein JXR83_23075 [Deltaproteobacteria bacterium]|nr:hypothetical protein [Deltaproteobacteria bacterium]
MQSLLAIDLGLRCGLALYGDDGRLRWYRSTNFGNRGRLRRAAFPLLRAIPDLRWLAAEGDRALAAIWARAALPVGAGLRLVPAETWRGRLLLRREQRDGRSAKASAGPLARRVIRWSGAPAPTSLRTDAAEAILIGLWAVLELGWLPALPPELT